MYALAWCGDAMRWRCTIFRFTLLAVLVLLLAHPAAARGNATSGIYPGTVKDVCVGDTIFVGETGLNLTPLTPNANGVVMALASDPVLPGGGRVKIPVSSSQATSFTVPSVSYSGTYYPAVNNQLLTAYPITIQQQAITGYPMNVVITTSEPWMVANGADSPSITVSVTDAWNQGIPGATVALSSGAPWALHDPVLVTDNYGKAQTSFLATTKSGTAVITASATVAGVTTAPVTSTLAQNIDADTPFSSVALYPATATVGTPVNVSVQVTDRFGNPVTSRRQPRNVSFFTTTSGTGRFADAAGNRVTALSVSLSNDTGLAPVTYYVGTKQGNNYLSISPPYPIASSIVSITGIGDSVPFSIIQVVNPSGNPPLVPADGSSQATIDYFLFDQWGNPSVAQGVKISTSVGENRLFYTNDQGRATVLYGPKLSAGFYTISAESETNSSVQATQTVQFGSMDPKDMLLTATPQTMASLDVNPSMVATVTALVIDERGNPVKGQTVTFRIEKSSNGTFIQNQTPYILGNGIKATDTTTQVPVTTDGNGQAMLYYYPGSFPTPKESGYNASSQGTTIIDANWAGLVAPVARNISLNYKNYPFISVYTDTSPKNVMVGDLVNVSVRLKGDGWALQPKPIDVILLFDRSATMLYNESISGGKIYSESPDDRMVMAMRAGQDFVDHTGQNDQIGVVSFGDPLDGRALLTPTGTSFDNDLDPYYWRAGKDYDCSPTQNQHSLCSESSHNTTDNVAYIAANYPAHGLLGRDYRVGGVNTGDFTESDLTIDHTAVKNAIRNMVPAGGTPMRQGIYDSVEKLLLSNRTGTVQAIVLLTDGQWDTTGDPQGVNRTAFGGPKYYDAVQHDLGDGTASVITWAKFHNIKIFTIALGSDTNKTQLREYSTETGGGYNETSTGVGLDSIYLQIAGQLRQDASINTTVLLDFNTMELNGNQTVAGATAFTYQHNDRSTYILSVDGTSVVADNTTDWSHGQFKFYPGTIKLNQQWMVNFSLMANLAGNIKVLSSKTSMVTFEGNEGQVSIPDTFVTTTPLGTEPGPTNVACTVNGPQRTNQPSDTQIAQLGWTTTYNGLSPKLTWQIWIAPPYSAAYQYVDTFNWSAPDPVSYNLLIRDFSPGNYLVKVKGNATDSSDCWSAPMVLNIYGPRATPQIKIQ